MVPGIARIALLNSDKPAGGTTQDVLTAASRPAKRQQRQLWKRRNALSIHSNLPHRFRCPDQVGLEEPDYRSISSRASSTSEIWSYVECPSFRIGEKYLTP